MGTRHLICAHIDGDYKLANYGQWDGYPDGQGVDVLAFAQRLADEPETKIKFLDNLRALRDLTAVELREIESDAKRHGTHWANEYPWLSRDAGSDILDYVLNQPSGLGIQRDIKFAAESLMCEWCYVLDFDSNTFEVFEGFNKEPLPSGARFGALTPEDKEFTDYDTGVPYKYYQVVLAAQWPLDGLPTKESFLETFRAKDDEDAA